MRATLLSATCFTLLVLTGACSTSLYKVKPLAEIKPMPDSAPSANVGPVGVRAIPLLTDEESQELFEANLQLAGLLSVRIEIADDGPEAVEISKMRFHLHDADGREWKSISVKKAISRILKANDVYAYNPNSRKTFEKEFRAYELDLKNPLIHSERRHGFLVFQAPRNEQVASPKGLILTVEGFSTSAKLPLN